MNTNKSLLEFPCEFAFKVFGLATNEFEVDVLAIIRKYNSDIKEKAIQSRLSKDQKYLALTITIIVETREQLDAIYTELNASPQVLMTL